MGWHYVEQGYDSGAFDAAVSEVLREVASMLVEKNRMYGNSALQPRAVFCNLSPVDRLAVRIDDKLNRIRVAETMTGADTEDAEMDLLGYLVLRQIAKREQQSVVHGFDDDDTDITIEETTP